VTTIFVFVRHGENDLISSRIAGRQNGVHLNEEGRKQAQKIADALSRFPIDAICSGPLERACETAAPLCQRLELPLQVAEEFNEIDFGRWTNVSFVDLAKTPEWQPWNSFRSFGVTPNDEMMIDVQARVLRKMRQLRVSHRLVVVFSHGDVIRAIVAYFLGTPLDLFLRIMINSGSISLIETGDDFARVRLVNGSVDAEDILPELARRD